MRRKGLNAEPMDQVQQELHYGRGMVARRQGLRVDVAAMASLSAQGQESDREGKDADAGEKSFSCSGFLLAVSGETNLVSVRWCIVDGKQPAERAAQHTPAVNFVTLEKVKNKKVKRTNSGLPFSVRNARRGCRG